MNRRIDRYEIVEPLGTGMFSTVYRAHDERLDTEVAIKVLAENHSLNADIRSRFITEARTLRRLSTPHVVTLHDLGETTDGQPYMVLERCAGGSLADRVSAARRGGRPVTADDVRCVADTLAVGLGAMHDIRVVHRDISPSNLLLRHAEMPEATVVVGPDDLVISDLGFVKDLDQASGLTAAGGTHGFAAPEQQQPGALIDHRADIYAATAVIEWLVDGQLSGLDGFFATGMATEPSERHDDMHAWRAELDRALTGPAHAPDVETHDPRQHRTLLVTAAVLLAALAFVGGYVVRGGDSTPDVERTTASGGDVTLTRSDGDLTITLTGPEEIGVGETATYTAEASGASSIVWVAPDGRTVVDQARLDIRANSAGTGVVTVIAVGTEGRLVIELEFRAG